jgi:HAD superfamily hydrolase (TIGR01509 family)
MVSWVFVDLGGTLWDERPWHAFLYRTYAEVLAESGHPVSPVALRSRLEELIRDHVSAYTRAYVLGQVPDEASAAAILREVARRTRDRAGELQPLLPGALELLDDLRQDHHIGILANQPSTVRPHLEATGVAARAELVLISGEVRLAKPDPAFYRLALERAACPPPEAVMVGDRIDNDVVPAKEVGMRTVRVRSAAYGIQEVRSDAERPDVEVSRLDDVPPAVRRL